MILHKNRLPADDTILMKYHALFLKSGKFFNCRLLQIIGGALRVKSLINPGWVKRIFFRLMQKKH